ncbi:serine hydrolase [Chelativorans salis]|uniref:Serine hydrolase n=1 Tax=Chelativorans salis TaxID=2978478 RepID=A0ABT2LNR0_9HYPH|nr:serine hydrolase [Chelativorans sp. EGI FJ00035]MCT7376044.1 serine hydrolase [Chelativorans sp. EGI FJ00035]
MRTLFTLAAISGLLTFPAAAGAQEPADPKTVLKRLFEAPELETEWFAPNFLAQIPAAQIVGVVEDLEKQYGSLQSISGEGQRFTITLERAKIPTRLVLDAEGRIAGLLFEPAVAAGALAEQVDAITGLPGRTALLVLSNGEERAAHNADVPLAVGSAAKLAVLKAVADAVSDERLEWDQVVPLDSEWRSLPSGILQDWPDGTPLTVATLANLMISISDNTATDALIKLVGREAVEAVTPRNTPFLTTRELFTLKADGNEEWRSAWIAGDEEARRDLLEQIASAPLPGEDALSTGPTIEIEWFLSGRELCTLMKEVADLPALHINPGLAASKDWREIAYKGGSETGVLNYTTWLEDAEGTSHCVVATWNNGNAAIEERQLVSSYRGILGALREGE